MRPHVQALFAVCLLGGAIATAAEAPLFVNVRVVSVDARTHAIVVRDNEGQSRLFRLDPQAAPPARLRRGEEVILTIEGGAAGQRVSRIQRSQAVPGGAGAEQQRASAPEDLSRPTAATSVPAPSEPPRSIALDAYANQVARLAQQSLQVDAAWNTFALACGVTLSSPRSRDWFALWEPGTLRVDLTSGVCRELQNQVVARGEQVKTAMQAAEDEARRAGQLPGELRDVKARYDLDWEGWALPAPAPLTP